MSLLLSSRRARAAAALAAALAAVIIIGTGTLAASRQGDRTIYVSALGGNGMPVTDPPLAANEFSVSEDGATREVTAVGKATGALYYTVLMDTSQGKQSQDRQYSTEMGQHMRAAVSSFSQAVLTFAPDSKILLMEFGSVAMVRQDFTSTLPELEGVIPKMLPQSGIPVLTEAIVEAAKRLAKAPSPRRVIISINLEPSPTESGRLDPQLVANEVQKAGASVWGISVRYGTKEDAPRDAMLKALATDSGGLRMTLPTPQQLPDFVRGVVAANSIVQYAVTYKRPADTPPAKVTTVTVSRAGVRALAKRWADK